MRLHGINFCVIELLTSSCTHTWFWWAPVSSIEGNYYLVNCWISPVAFSSAFESIFRMLLNIRKYNQALRFLCLSAFIGALKLPWILSLFLTGDLFSAINLNIFCKPYPITSAILFTMHWTHLYSGFAERRMSLRDKKS